MKRLGLCALFLLALAVTAYAVLAYGFLPLGSVVHPDMKASFLVHRAGLYAHVFAAAVALAFGPFQFLSAGRRRFAMLHRWMGRAYLGVGVLVGGVSGLYLAAFAFGGGITRPDSPCWPHSGFTQGCGHSPPSGAGPSPSIARGWSATMR